MTELEKIERDANDLDKLVDMAEDGEIPMEDALNAFSILAKENPKAFAFGLIRNLKAIFDEFEEGDK